MRRLGGHGRGRGAVLAVAAAVLGALVFAAPASAFVKVTSFDGSRTPAGSMVPDHMAVDQSTGDVYVIDSANDVVDRFDQYGKYLGQLVGTQTPMGTFGFDGSTDAVAVDNSSASTRGDVYVVGSNGSSGGGFSKSIITALKPDGALLWQQAASSLSFPPFGWWAGVAVDPTSGDLWVGDRASGHGVLQLNPANGSPIGSFIDSSSDPPGPIAFDSAGDLYAAGYLEPLRKLTPPVTSSSPTLVDPYATTDIAIDATTNDVYADRGDHINVFNGAGVQDPNSPFGSTTSSLAGIAVNGTADRIYVSNLDTNAVEIWAHNMPTMDALTVTVTGSGAGTVDADHGAILGCTNGGGVCTDSYQQGDTVTLTAKPTSGVFTGWSGPDAGACAGTTTACAVPVSAAKSITATFNPPVERTVTVSKNGTGSGTVTVTGTSHTVPGTSIVCGVTCSGPFDDGTVAKATAVAAAGSMFSGWTVSGCSGTGACSFSVSGDMTVTATFALNAPAVSTGGASGVGEAGATVGGTVNPSGNDVTDCHFDYGPSTAYGSSAPCAPSPGSGASAVGVSAALAGLAAGTTYHYRVVAASAGGTADGSDGTFTTSTPTITFQPPQAGCPQDLTKCAPPRIGFAGFTGTTMLVRLSCAGFAGQPACTGRLTFKAVIRVRVKHGKRSKLVKRTITAATGSYSVAAGATGSLKLNLTGAGRAALRTGSLTVHAQGLAGAMTIPRLRPARSTHRLGGRFA